jgi:hypothetical protein
MFIKPLFAIAIIPVLSFALLGNTSPTHRHLRESFRPEFLTVPSSADSGTSISGTVYLDGVPDTDQVVSISGSAGKFSSLPSTVTVVAGSYYANFNATVSPTASGSASITGRANGGAATGTLAIHLTNPGLPGR